MKTIYYLKMAVVGGLLWAGLPQKAQSQCTGCTASYDESASGSINLNNGDKICITGNTTMGIGNANGSSTICIAQGVTWVPSGGQSNYNNVTFEVYGTLVVNALAGNGDIRMNIKPGGILNFSGTSIPAQYTLTNEGTINLQANSPINISAKVDNKSGAVISALGGDNSLLMFSDTPVTNNGTIEATHLENSHTNPFLNEGSVIIKGVFYQHGKLVNRGSIETQCGVATAGAGLPGCSFLVGDKNTTDFLNDGGTITINGNTTVSGQINMEGGKLIIETGNLIVNKPIIGCGQLVVLSGTATSTGDGRIGQAKVGNDCLSTSECTDGFQVYVHQTDNHDFNTSGANNQNAFCYSVLTENPLPVLLTEFSVHPEGQTAAMIWKTVEEADSKEFEIEKSTDLKQWITVGKVAAAGNFKGEKVYKFSDSNPAGNVVYYRLKMTDLDGSYEYTTYRSVSFQTNVLEYFYPNPASDVLYISDNQPDKISSVFIYNQSGAVVAVFKASLGQGLDISHLAAGRYFARVVYTDNTKKVFNIIIAR